MQVVQWLSDAGIDLLEISGGNYEQMSMVGIDEDDSGQQKRKKAASTLAREAYFLAFAQKVRPLVNMPMMITGGMRSLAAMEEALQTGACEVIGIGRPMCYAPDISGDLLGAQTDVELPAIEKTLAMARDALGPDVDDQTFKTIESFGMLGWFCLQLLLIGNEQEPDAGMTVFDALSKYKQSEAEALELWSRP